jgi:serine/threonine protein kinase
MRRASVPTNFKFGAVGPDRTDRTLAVTAMCPKSLAKISPSWVMDLFAVHRCIATGLTSRVYSASVRGTGTKLVLKTYIKAELNGLTSHQVRREIDIHSRVSHPHVVDMWGAFEDDERFVILMELGKGDLKDLVDMGGGTFDEAVTADAMRQVLSALEHLHSMNIAHRDVKPENVVVAMDGTLKLADFGLSIDLSKERAVTRVGTLALMAPEVVACPCKVAPRDNKSREDLWYGVKVDTWSCGVMAYELMTCRSLFNAPTPTSTMFAITYRQICLPTSMSDGAKRFIKRALSRLQIFRPTAGWLLQHDFLKGAGVPLRPPPRFRRGQFL